MHKEAYQPEQVGLQPQVISKMSHCTVCLDNDAKYSSLRGLAVMPLTAESYKSLWKERWEKQKLHMTKLHNSMHGRNSDPGAYVYKP